MMLMFAVGCVAGEAPDDQTATTSQNSSHPSTGCQNNSVISGVTCSGTLLVLPINIDIRNVGVLNDNYLTILSNNLNGLDVGGILNNNELLNYLDVNVLNIFDNVLHIPVGGNDVNVCTAVLGLPLCSGY